MGLTIRGATLYDVQALVAIMNASIDELQKGFLDEAQIAASHAIMGVDSQLVEDGTCYVVECDGEAGGCGGWSRRATLYGGDHAAGRDARALDPATEAARVRAMYTHPRFARRGIGRLILSTCEEAAAAEGFTRLELMATLSGEPLYRAAGFEAVERVTEMSTGTPIPLVKMTKALVR